MNYFDARARPIEFGGNTDEGWGPNDEHSCRAGIVGGGIGGYTFSYPDWTRTIMPVSSGQHTIYVSSLEDHYTPQTSLSSATYAKVSEVSHQQVLITIYPFTYLLYIGIALIIIEIGIIAFFALYPTRASLGE